MEGQTKKLAEIALKHGKAMSLEMIVECAIPALNEAIQKSENKIDDALLASLGEPLKQALIDAINKINID